MGDEAHRVVAPLPQPHLEQRLRAGRDAQLAAPRALAGQQLGLLAWWVIAIGRVCGTAIGTEPIDTTRVTPNRSTTVARRGRTPPSGCRARDRGAGGTACRRCRAPAGRPAGARRSARSGRGRTTSVAGGPGSRGTGRRRRSPRPGPRTRSTRCWAARAAALPASRKPSSATHHRQPSTPVELGHLVDDVHQAVRSRMPSSLRGTAARVRSGWPAPAPTRQVVDSISSTDVAARGGAAGRCRRIISSWRRKVAAHRTSGAVERARAPAHEHPSP